MSMTQQMATAQDSEHTESEGDGDDSDDNSEPAVLGADELDKDEEMDDLETLMVALNDGSELPKGQSNPAACFQANLGVDLALLVDWIKFIDGVTRSKRLQLKELFQQHFPHVKLPSIWRINEKLESMLQLKPQVLQCCPNICEAYTGAKAEALTCSFCGTARYYEGSLRPRKEWIYFPLLPRLQKQYQDLHRAEKLTTYRAKFDNPRTENRWDITDVFDGELYQELLHKEAMEGVSQAPAFK